MLKQEAEQLIPLIKKLESHITVKDIRNDSVSKSDVAWQIDHSLKVINLVSKSLILSNPIHYTNQFNKWRFLLFNLNYIPRGRAKAPKMVAPPDEISKELLESQIQLAFENIEQLKVANKNAYFKHFVFGTLNKKRTIRFLKLHTNHHLKIIKDILK
jgi:hypothetical protein